MIDAIYSMSTYKALDPNGFQPIFFVLLTWKRQLLFQFLKPMNLKFWWNLGRLAFAMFFKLITKVLVQRISPRLENLIGPL